jgi:hypothetical protein
VFSFGVVLWEVYTYGQMPLEDVLERDILAGHARLEVPADCDPRWASLMQVGANMLEMRIAPPPPPYLPPHTHLAHIEALMLTGLWHALLHVLSAHYSLLLI